ncbi:hypothetical protein AB205_0167330 [Aquarana catesbeiana]|uniref:Uncharacterized protein n=1 Tax=Aquarana catesbeiana TaxID=8400 RepID=A0A2G9S4N2_AQUCT|nr:hypothetical protein AB205_0167330 [Aquarana catesbeiana]
MLIYGHATYMAQRPPPDSWNVAPPCHVTRDVFSIPASLLNSSILASRPRHTRTCNPASQETAERSIQTSGFFDQTRVCRKDLKHVSNLKSVRFSTGKVR